MSEEGRMEADALIRNFSTEEFSILKEMTDKKKKDIIEAEAKAEKHKAFHDVYDKVINDSDVAQHKDLVEEVLKENPEFKDLGSQGAGVVLKMAKLKAGSKSVEPVVGSTPEVDNVTRGTKEVATPENLNDKGIPVMASNPNLIDWSKVDLDRLHPVQREFAERQRNKQRFQ